MRINTAKTKYYRDQNRNIWNISEKNYLKKKKKIKNYLKKINNSLLRNKNSTDTEIYQSNLLQEYIWSWYNYLFKAMIN